MPAKARKPAPSDYEARLTALRDTLTASIEEAPPYSRGSLARQLIAVLALLNGMHPLEATDRVDDLARARAARRANPEGEQSAGGRDTRRPPGSGATLP